MVLRPAESPFCRNSRLPLSSTMQIVTCTFRFSASASAAVTIVLTAARLRNFLLGRSAADVNVIRVTSNATSLGMPIILASFVWGLAESSFFFFVPDVGLTFLALRNYRAALRATLAALAGALIGGALMYAWGFN